MYKVLAKLLANGLKRVVGKVISENQTAFIKDRHIYDGVMIAIELVDDVKHKKKQLMLFKIYFEKHTTRWTGISYSLY